MKFKLVASICIFACVVGCAGGSPFTKIEVPRQDKGALYVYIPSTNIGGWSCPKFAINSGNVHSISNGKYARIELSPGENTISMNTSWCYAFPLQLTFTVKKEETIFIRLTQSDTWQPGSFRGSQRGDPWSRFEIVPSRTATEELKGLRAAE